jgi:hypothetical protein
LQGDLLAVAKRETAETVPLGLILPIRPGGQLRRGALPSGDS